MLLQMHFLNGIEFKMRFHFKRACCTITSVSKIPYHPKKSAPISDCNFRLNQFDCTIRSLTLSQCTLAGSVYTGMPLECHWLTQCTLGYHLATQRILAGYTGTPLEKLSWNSPRWNATGETLAFATYTGTPLEGLGQPTQAPTHILKHSE